MLVYIKASHSAVASLHSSFAPHLGKDADEHSVIESPDRLQSVNPAETRKQFNRRLMSVAGTIDWRKEPRFL